jgi:hypothetical protein
VSLTHSQVTVTYYSHCIILLLSSLLSQPKMALSLSNPNLSNSPLSSLREHTHSNPYPKQALSYSLSLSSLREHTHSNPYHKQALSLSPVA